MFLVMVLTSLTAYASTYLTSDLRGLDQGGSHRSSGLGNVSSVAWLLDEGLIVGRKCKGACI